MASMRRLNRQLLRWHRYAHKTCWNPRVTRPAWQLQASSISFGHRRAWDAHNKEIERRQCFRVYGMRCLDCGLPDLHHGQGDGIGSCECPRCYSCGAPPGGCDCVWTEDDWGDDVDDGADLLCPCATDPTAACVWPDHDDTAIATSTSSGAGGFRD